MFASFSAPQYGRLVSDAYTAYSAAEIAYEVAGDLEGRPEWAAAFAQANMLGERLLAAEAALDAERARLQGCIARLAL